MTLDLLSPSAVVMVARLLLESRWCAPHRWPLVAIVLTPETRRVMLRAELAEDFRRNDLVQLAHEVIARRVGPGEILVHVQVDDATGAGARLAVVDLRAEMARAAP